MSPQAEAMLERLFERASQLSLRVDIGLLQFIDAVDMAYSAALWSGVIDLAGDDAVQSVLARAFLSVPRRAK